MAPKVALQNLTVDECVCLVAELSHASRSLDAAGSKKTQQLSDCYVAVLLERIAGATHEGTRFPMLLQYSSDCAHLYEFGNS
eukprot:6459499-Amphidinium_carterae.2